MSRKIYRDPDNGKLGGVAAGLARYLEVDVLLVRGVFLLGLLVTGFLTFFLYMAAWLLLDKRPSGRTEFTSSFAGETDEEISTDLAIIEHRFAALEPRLEALERMLTSSEFRVRREFNHL